MDKLDLKKELKTLYSTKKNPVIVTVPPIKYITLEGKGNPNTSEDYQNAIGVLYGLAFTIKFDCKKDGRDFAVMPLEGQWWSDDILDFSEDKKDEWLWKAMIALPDFVSNEIFSIGKEKLRKKKNPPLLDKAKLETIIEGEAVQVLYIGPYSEEARTIADLHEFASEQGFKLRGKHREIYLSNLKRTAPEKLKTIIRHPVERK